MSQQLNDKRNDDHFMHHASASTASASIIYNKFSAMADKLFETHIGQTVMNVTERLLLIIEETTKWSLPQDNTEVKLVRPLPWLLFLVLIIWLRVLRFCLSICAIMVGYQMITPQIFLFFIQTQRQKIHDKRQLIAVQKTRKEKLCLRARLRLILSYIICRPGYIMDEPSTSEILLYKSHDNFNITGNSEPSMELAATHSDNNLITNDIIENYGMKRTDIDDEGLIINASEWKKPENTTFTSTQINEIANQSNQIHDELEINEEELNDLKRTDNQLKNHCQQVNDDGSSTFHIAHSKFIIHDCPNIAVSRAASTPINNNIDNKKADNKAIALKQNTMAEEINQDGSDHESNATMKTSCYLSTITPITVVNPNFEYHSSNHNVLSNCNSLHDAPNIEGDNKTTARTTTITTSCKASSSSTSSSTSSATTIDTTLENASSTDDLYYSPIGSPYPSFCNFNNTNDTNDTNDNSLIDASVTPTPTNDDNLDNMNAACKKPEFQETSQINDSTSHKKSNFKSSNNHHHISKHHNNNKNRVKHHHYY